MVPTLYLNHVLALVPCVRALGAAEEIRIRHFRAEGSGFEAQGLGFRVLAPKP